MCDNFLKTDSHALKSNLISREQLFELYLAADIGVIPSLFEPFGYVAVEMMMCGLPVIVTATSGLDEIHFTNEDKSIVVKDSSDDDFIITESCN